MGNDKIMARRGLPESKSVFLSITKPNLKGDKTITGRFIYGIQLYN